MMSRQEYMRQLPGAAEHFQRPRTWIERIHMDPVLLFLLGVLVLGGLFVLYSGSGSKLEDVGAQAARFGVAFVVMMVFAQLQPSVYRRWSPWLYGIGLLALVGVLVAGVGAKGAQRWLQLPGLPRFQPSEFMKLAMPMMVAWFLASKALPPKIWTVLLTLLLVMVPAVLIIKQPDLGTSILVVASGMFVLFFAGLSWRLISIFVAGVVTLAPVMWFFVMHDYQKKRVLTLLDPTTDPLGAGWNIIQSTTAIGSGGLDGKGWLQGMQSHLDFLPESHRDFIIAVMAEEFGFIGVCCLLFWYFLIIARCLYISARSGDTYARLLGGALTLTFFVYVFVNMGMVSGILPIVGVPLPLVSYGGTSVVTLMAGFGILMSIHTHNKNRY